MHIFTVAHYISEMQSVCCLDSWCHFVHILLNIKTCYYL